MTKLSFLLLLLLLGGCTTNIDISLPYEGKKLVLYCLLSPDRIVSARLDQTYPPTGKFLFVPPIGNATVQLLENQQVIETLAHAGDGMYVSAKKYQPVANRNYQIKVSAAGFPDLESDTETIPLPPQVVSSSFEKPSEYRLSVEIQDYKNQIDQYSIQITGTYTGKVIAINTSNLSRPDGISDNCGFRGNSNSFYYRDVCFEGKTLKTSYSSTLFGTVQGLSSEESRKLGNKQADQAQIRVRNVSNAYFEYYKFYPPEDIDLAFKQPASRVYNLKGGYGLFASYNEQVVLFENK